MQRQNGRSEKKTNSRWITCLKPNPSADFRLICFPFAGCGANFYRPWADFICDDKELNAIRLPGRETRSTETCVQDMESAITAIVNEISCLLWRQPLVFFGHSMGAVMAFEVSRRLKALYQWEPRFLFVSGHQAPYVPSNDNFHRQPEAVLIEELKRLEGCSPLVFEDEELLQLYLPILRSDYSIIENYEYRTGDLLKCPVATCTGDEDSEVTPAEIQQWQAISEGPFFNRIFKGGHFYINSNLEYLTAFIKDCLVTIS